MATYFLRRLLLMVPTFLGSTILVFIILQIAPGGPIERAIMEMQMGGEESGVSASGELGGSVLPESALKELKRFYGFDKPIYQRYLIWLGVWPREIKHREVVFDPGELKVEKRVGKRDGKLWFIDIENSNNKNIFKIKESMINIFSEDGSLLAISIQIYNVFVDLSLKNKDLFNI